MNQFELDFDNLSLSIAVADTEELRNVGLSGVSNVDGGMLFVFPYVGSHRMWMRDTQVPLRIYFVNQTGIITEFEDGRPENDALLGSRSDTKYVLEVPSKIATAADILPGDEIQIPEEFKEAQDFGESPSAVLLDQFGNEQIDVMGGERVFSRKSTAEMVSLAKKAKDETSFIKLGKLVVDEINKQESLGTQYVASNATKYTYSKGGGIDLEDIEEDEDTEYVPLEIDFDLDIAALEGKKVNVKKTFDEDIPGDMPALKAYLLIKSKYDNYLSLYKKIQDAVIKK
jgi:uncharacterized membrane protein (UPF0127 family)